MQRPTFLNQPEETWPHRPADLGEISNDDPEIKKAVQVFTNEANEQSDRFSKAIEKFPSWTRLKKVVAGYCATRIIYTDKVNAVRQTKLSATIQILLKSHP